MGVFSGPDVSESGLVLAFDLANIKSYPDSVNYYSTPETLTNGRVGSTSGGNYTDFISGGPDGGRFTRWINDTGTSGSTAWHWSIDYSNTGLSTGQLVVISFYARCPNGTVSNITLNSPDSTIVTATLDTNWRLFTGAALYGGDYVSTPFVRINRSNTNTFANGATYDIALLKVQKGNVLTNMTGGGNTGTLTNGPTYSSANGGSIVFDGTDDYVTTGFTRGTLGNYLTLTAWYKYAGTSGRTYSAIIGGKEAATEFFIGKNTGNTNIGVQDGNYYSDFVTGSNAFDGNWHQIVYSYDNGTGKIYLDGILRNTNTFTKCNDAEEIIIGGETEGSGYYFNGNISLVSFYNRVLTAAEIQQNFNATRGRYGI